NGFPLPIEFSQLSLNFNLKEYNTLVHVTDIAQLKFLPDEQRILSFHFAPKSDHVQLLLEVKEKQNFALKDFKMHYSI
ncbi:unnamed protein product, partial [Rotaria socialis]